METCVFVACWLFLPQILTSAKLSEVFGSFWTDIFEELECDSSYLLFIGVQIKKDNGIVFAAEDACHLL